MHVSYGSASEESVSGYTTIVQYDPSPRITILTESAVQSPGAESLCLLGWASRPTPGSHV